MIIKRVQIEVSGQSVEVVYKDIKNLYVSVRPPDGHVRVSAPLRFDETAVRSAVETRLGWIRKHQERLARRDRSSRLQLMTGESHFFMGQPYTLELRSDGPTGVSIVRPGVLQLSIRPGADRNARERLLSQWYRQELKWALPELVAKWEPAIGVKVADARIKRMKTRWGSCNPTARRIWLNLELAKRSPTYLEYVLVHEMVHIIVPRHDAKFRALMDHHMPDWRLLRKELNHAPMSELDSMPEPVSTGA